MPEEPNPKSSETLKLWLHGNRLHGDYNEHKPSQHFTVDMHALNEWFTDPEKALQCWDCFPEALPGDEQRLNTITRTIIVVLTLLIIVGVTNWLLFLVAVVLVILILWFTMIPTTRGATHCKKLPNVEYLRCSKPRKSHHPSRAHLFSYVDASSPHIPYRIIPKNI